MELRTRLHVYMRARRSEGGSEGGYGPHGPLTSYKISRAARVPPPGFMVFWLKAITRQSLIIND